MSASFYRIIRVDGTEEIIEETPTMRKIQRALAARGVDTVTLDRRRGQVMIVDDEGMIDGKPVNAKATALYHSICKPGTIHSIHGDVAIVNDNDFA